MTIQTPDSVIDVLTRSILMHPTFFAEACEAEAREDRRYVSSRPDMAKRAKGGAIARANALEFAAKAARERASAAVAAMEIVDRKTASWIAAFNVACRLQCIPAHRRTALAVKWDAENAA